MFTSRGYNIDSLTVADISEDHATRRDHHCHQGRRQSSIRSSRSASEWCRCNKSPDLTEEAPCRARAGAGQGQVVQGTSGSRRCARPTSTAPASSTRRNSFIFEITGADKIDTFVTLMREVGVVEVGRTELSG